MVELINLIETLVKFQSEAGNESEQKNILDYIAKKLPGKKEFFLNKGIHSLYIKSESNNGPNILLSGHVDVIPAAQKLYSPINDGEFLHGRGAGDMKAGVGIFMKLFEKYSSKINLSMLLTNDEELGGPNGAGYIVNNKLIPKPDLVLVSESSGCKYVLNEKGAIWLDIKVKGPGGHASRPWRAQNAIEILNKLLEEIRINIPVLDEHSWTNSMNIGAIHGGKLEVNDNKIIELGKANSIAQTAYARLDLRLTENTSHEDMVQFIKKIASKYKLPEEYSVSVNEGLKVEHLHTPHNNQYVQDFILQHKKFGSLVEKKGTGASDGRYFSKLGVPVMIYGPISIDTHADNERVLISSIHKVYEVLDNYLQNLK